MYKLNEKSRILNSNLLDSEQKKDYECKDIFKIFDLFQKLIEKKPQEVKSHFTFFIEILLSYRNTEILEIRARVGKSLICLFQLNFEISNKIQKEIFFFFFNNFRVENYDLNLSASEFFLFFLENQEEFLKKNINNKSLFSEKINLIDFNTNIFTPAPNGISLGISEQDENQNSELIDLADLFEKFLKQ